MDIQAFVDTIGKAAAYDRAKTQMTLGALIDRLASMDQGVVVKLGAPISYRGYYCDLAFEPSDEGVTVEELLKTCRDCDGKEFTGYKGGEFIMDRLTPIWVAEYGQPSANRIMGVEHDGTLILSPEDDEDD